VKITVYNEAGEAVRHLYAQVDDPSKLVTDVSLSQDVITPRYGESGTGDTTATMIQLSNGVAVLWDGRNDAGEIVRNGQYYVEVRSTNGSGSEIIVTRHVTVQTLDAGEPKVVAAPNVLTATHPWTVFRLVSSQEAMLKVKIYAVSGEKVASLSGKAGELEWRPDRLASGYYLAYVEKSAPDGRSLGRTLLPLLIVR